MRGRSSILGAAAVAAALVAGSLAQSQAHAQPLWRPVDPDPAATRWIRYAGWRLDRVLGPAPYALQRAAGAHGELRIAEATLQIDERGVIKSWAITRATGQFPLDDAMTDAAEDLTMINLPPPPPSIVGRPIVLQVGFVTPPRIGPRGSLMKMEPLVLIPPSYQAAVDPNAPDPVVVKATR
ncbi:hypothetical protein [Caulobacter sp. 17J80-11]|uniref:hypothetical protein n=1 Tax=Caulobacter sp. 17J80-11 TaxID=2763502 RepID=UPI001653DB64|nr:hypothetical protein [Caulobacter sp. 17J80-11]MBC6982121.1 hypothetical protein [Caulobacter sp. 17J80-11]